MQGIFDTANYQLALVSAPAGAAALALLVVLLSTVLMRGAAALRSWLLLSVLGLIPLAIAITLVGSTTSSAVAVLWLRIGLSFVPLAAGATLCFHLALIGQLRRRPWAPVLVMLVGIAWIPVVAASNLIIVDATPGASGVFAPVLAPTAIIMALYSLAVVTVGLGVLGRAMSTPSTAPRRAWRRMFWSTLAVGVGIAGQVLLDPFVPVPVSWGFVVAGAITVVTALWSDDVLRVRAIDTRAPLLLVYLAFTIVAGWAALDILAVGMPWWISVIVMLAVFLTVRLGVAALAMLLRGGRRAEGPLQRIIHQFVARASSANTEAEVAAMACASVALATGIEPKLLPPPQTPLWFAERGTLLLRDEVELTIEPSQREEAQALLDSHGAAALVPVATDGKLIAMLAIPMAAQGRLRRTELVFLAELAPHVASGLLLARVTEQARQRVAADRDLELAAAIQAGFIPKPGTHVLGGLVLAGTWQPASRCSGDFWSFYPLPSGQVLLAIGDVTGHGVSAALVTAAAKGAADVAVRTALSDPARAVMEALDAAVRRVGAGRLHMTCGVTLLDPARGEATVYAAGHGSPLRLRATDDGSVLLTPMLARGNPLGSDAAPAVPTRHALTLGDLVVWYSDGLTDCEDAEGRPFGERRLIRLLRGLTPAQLHVETVRDAIMDTIGAYQGGRAQPDDATLLVVEVCL